MPNAIRVRRHVPRAVLLLALALVAAPGALMAGGPPVRDAQFWTPTIVQAQLAGRWSLQADTQVKLVDDLHEMQYSLFRLALVFAAGKHVTINVGYAWGPYF